MKKIYFAFALILAIVVFASFPPQVCAFVIGVAFLLASGLGLAFFDKEDKR